MIEQEGPGWRLARDTSRTCFPIIIGGAGWALELTEQEWQTLIPLIRDLVSEHKKMESQLMKEESITLEIERLPWWGCLEGHRDSWSLQLIFEGDENLSRGFEAFWPDPAAKSITFAMRNMWDSCN